jgi:hypothetical protein
LSVQDTIRENLMAAEPELWNELVLSGRTEKVVGLMLHAYETGLDVAAVGAGDSEDIEAVLDRTCNAFATAYATFCVHMMQTKGHEVPPEFHSVQGQLQAATLQAVPAFLRTLAEKLQERGVKPLDPHAIRVAQEVPPVKTGGLILP